MTTFGSRVTQRGRQFEIRALYINNNNTIYAPIDDDRPCLDTVLYIVETNSQKVNDLNAKKAFVNK